MVAFLVLPHRTQWGVLPKSHKGGHVGSRVIAGLLAPGSLPRAEAQLL